MYCGFENLGMARIWEPGITLAKDTHFLGCLEEMHREIWIAGWIIV